MRSREYRLAELLLVGNEYHRHQECGHRRTQRWLEHRTRWQRDSQYSFWHTILQANAGVCVDSVLVDHQCWGIAISNDWPIDGLANPVVFSDHRWQWRSKVSSSWGTCRWLESDRGSMWLQSICLRELSNWCEGLFERKWFLLRSEGMIMERTWASQHTGKLRGRTESVMDKKSNNYFISFFRQNWL